jgi:hypothetical protein
MKRATVVTPDDADLDLDVAAAVDSAVDSAEDQEVPEDDGDGEDVLGVTDGPAGDRIPIFPGVKVVYLGSSRHHAPTLKGRVLAENVGGTRKETRGPDGQVFVAIVGGTDVKQASPHNFTNYDFRAYDLAGVKSSKRISAQHKRAELRDRPFQDVEHGEHIYHFAREKAKTGDYELLVADTAKFAVREYIAARERSRKLKQRFIDRATT